MIQFDPKFFKIVLTEPKDTFNTEVKPAPPNLKFEKYTSVDKLGIIDCTISPDYTTIALCTPTKKIYLYYTDNLKMTKVLQGHTERINCISYIGSKLISGSNDKTIRIWNDKGEEKVIEAKYFVKKFIVIDQETFATCENTEFKIWSLNNREILYIMKTGSRISQMCSLGPLCLCTLSDLSTKLYNLSTNSLLKEFKIHNSINLEHQAFLDSNTIIFSFNNSLKIFDISTESFLKEIQKDNYQISESNITSNQLVITGTTHFNTIKIWNFNEKQYSGFPENYLLQSLFAHSDYVTSIISLPNNKFISASWDGYLMLWKTPILSLLSVRNMVKVTDVNFIFV